MDCFDASWRISKILRPKCSRCFCLANKNLGPFYLTAKGCEVHETGGSNMSLTFLAHFLRKEKKKQTVGNFCQNKMTIIQRTALKIFKYLNKCFRKKPRIFQTIFKWWALFFDHCTVPSLRPGRPDHPGSPGQAGAGGVGHSWRFFFPGGLWLANPVEK